MTIFRYAILSMLIISLWACKSDPKTETPSSALVPATMTLSQLEANYAKEANPTSGNALIVSIVDRLKDASLKDTERISLLQKGYEVAKAQGINARASGFLFSILKESNSTPNPDQVFELGQLMKSGKKEAAANILFNSILENSPSWERISEVKPQITETFSSSDAYIQSLGEALFQNVDNTGINRTAAMKYVNACEAYGLAYPGNTEKTPDYLFKAAEVAKSIRTFPKSLSIYDWILDKYPNYEKTPTSLFLKGFIIENNLKDDKMAKDIYNEFLSKYPKHDLADDVEFLIANLGKTDQEILEMIESKKKK